MNSPIIMPPTQEGGFPLQPSETEEGPRSRIIVDGHVDLPYYAESRGIKEPLSDWKTGPWTPAGARQAGVMLWGTALYCEDAFNGKEALRRYRAVLETAKRLLGEIPIIRRRQELDAFGTFLILENADCLADSPSFVDDLADDGVIMVGLTHSGSNRLADGNAVRYSDGLTARGRQVVRALGAGGLLLDTAHLNEKCFWDVMRIWEGPLVSSHTGIRDVCNIPRNITREQAREIMDRGGVVGISVNPEMLTLSGHASLYDVYAHIDTLVQRYGPDCVGIGSDFCGFDEPATGLEQVEDLGKLADLLKEKGYGEEAVRAIIGGNWISLLGKSMPSHLGR